MRVLVQRVTRGRVTVDGREISAIGAGVVLLVGITHDDDQAQVEKLARKVAHLRIFEDDEGKMNRSLLDQGGAALVVSQFTLYGDARKGRRPSFVKAARPPHAEPLVEAFMDGLRQMGVGEVRGGQFGASMRVEILNDGPVTIWLDSDEL